MNGPKVSLPKVTQPKVTMAMPAYAQEGLVGPAIESLLAQDYEGPMELLVIEDGSPDRTHEVIKEIFSRYKGPIACRLVQNKINCGYADYNRLTDLAQGELVVIAHADDVSLPQRVSTLVGAWCEAPVSLLSSNALYVDQDTKPCGLYRTDMTSPDLSVTGLVSARPHAALLEATMAWPKALFERFGPLDQKRIGLVADWMLPFRAVLLKGIRYLNKPLLLYRDHSTSASAHFLRPQSDQRVINEIHNALEVGQVDYMFDTLTAFSPQCAQENEHKAQAWDAVHARRAHSMQDWVFCRNRMADEAEKLAWQRVRPGVGL